MNINHLSYNKMYKLFSHVNIIFSEKLYIIHNI